MTYSQERVEQLIPSLWDRTYAWGMQSETTPDPDMPRSKYKSPKEATTYWTHLIDIRMAWKHAPLTLQERRAILLYHHLGWSEKGIALHESVSQQAVSKRINKGVRTMTEWLNADYEGVEDK